RRAPREILEIRPRNVGALRGFRRGASDDEDAVLVLDERIRAQHDAFDPAEDRGIRADTERETENGDGRESRVPSQQPETKADVLQHLIEPYLDPNRARVF